MATVPVNPGGEGGVAPVKTTYPVVTPAPDFSSILILLAAAAAIFFLLKK